MSERTEIVLIVDRSGSMAPRKGDVIGGLQTFLERQKSIDGEATVTLVTFSSEVNTIYENRPLAKAEPLTTQNYVTFGNTALYDAIGITLTALFGRLDSTPKDQKPSRTIVVIITDGEENDSKTWTHEKQKALADSCESRGVALVYIGANQDAFTNGAKVGAVGMTYAASASGTAEAFAGISRGVMSYRTSEQSSAKSRAREFALAYDDVPGEVPTKGEK